MTRDGAPISGEMTEAEILEVTEDLRKMFPGGVWPGTVVMVFSRAGDALDWIHARVVDLLGGGGVRVRLPTGQLADRRPGQWRELHPLERLALQDAEYAEGLPGSPSL